MATVFRCLPFLGRSSWVSSTALNFNCIVEIHVSQKQVAFRMPLFNGFLMRPCFLQEAQDLIVRFPAGNGERVQLAVAMRVWHLRTSFFSQENVGKRGTISRHRNVQFGWCQIPDETWYQRWWLQTMTWWLGICLKESFFKNGPVNSELVNLGTLLWCFLLCFIVMTGWAMLVVEIVYPAVKDNVQGVIGRASIDDPFVHLLVHHRMIQNVYVSGLDSCWVCHGFASRLELSESPPVLNGSEGKISSQISVVCAYVFLFVSFKYIFIYGRR